MVLLSPVARLQQNHCLIGRRGRIFIAVLPRTKAVLIPGLLAVVAVAMGVAVVLAWARRPSHRPQNLGSVSQRWLSVHRTEI
jgi:hypothetical protein